MKNSFLPQIAVTLHSNFIPLLAQASVEDAVNKFISFLSLIFLLIGALCIAYGGYQLAAHGRIMEGLVAIIGGLLIALAIPLMKWFLTLAGVNI